MSCLAFFAGHSALHRLDPRARLIVVLILSTVTALSSCWSVLLWSLALGAALAIGAQLHPRRLARRMLHVNIFMFFLWLVLPFSTPGTITTTFGGIAITLEGLRLAAQITLKGNAVTLMFTALAATIPPAQLGCALNALAVPDKLAYLFTLVARYTDWIHDEYTRLRSAMKIRAFSPRFSLHTMRTFGYLVGLLVLRCIERSERALAAMKCRGFDGRFHSLTVFRFRPADMLFGLVTLFHLLAWIWLEFK